ncbi:MAG TPA: outer membrane beta-barrel protein [Candidatus Acidoferrum sp.]|nr:outer membrane beta-barrel protein [Candidatus Acidoferrum sp.]
MRNLFIPAALVLFFATPSLAQETPKAELFGGYEYLHLNPGGRGCHGGGGNLAYNLNNWVGAVGDFGICKETGLPSGLSAHDFNYLFGPRVSYRELGKLTPFAQILFGGHHLGTNVGSSNSFAFTLGGGADYKFTDHVAFRGQVEYLHTHFGGVGQDNTRVEAGIVYRWGGR